MMEDLGFKIGLRIGAVAFYSTMVSLFAMAFWLMASGGNMIFPNVFCEVSWPTCFLFGAMTTYLYLGAHDAGVKHGRKFMDP
jgi:hypothetical protein